MKFAVFASLLASAAAFAPAKQAAKTTSLAAFEDALGAQPPVSPKSVAVVPTVPMNGEFNLT